MKAAELRASLAECEALVADALERLAAGAGAAGGLSAAAQALRSGAPNPAQAARRELELELADLGPLSPPASLSAAATAQQARVSAELDQSDQALRRLRLRMHARHLSSSGGPASGFSGRDKRSTSAHY